MSKKTNKPNKKTYEINELNDATKTISTYSLLCTYTIEYWAIGNTTHRYEKTKEE